MRQNDTNEQPCMSVRCCCKLIAKCEEKPIVAKTTPKPRNSDCGKHTQMSLCDFLKSQPIPDWIKVNDTRPQQHPRDEQCSTKPTSDERKGNTVPEDMQSSQIIINFGTVVTNGACKRDSCQQTDPEVKDVTVPMEKNRVCQTTTSPPVDRPSATYPSTNRPTSVCPPVNRSTSVCPTPDQSTSTYPQTNRPTSNCPSTNNRQTSTGPPTNRPTSICPPKDHSMSTCPPTNQSTSTCAKTNRPTSNFPSSNQSTSNAAPTNRPTSTCPPANRSTSTCPAARPESVVNKSTCGCNCHSKL
ncbi:salivary glue protein Sgs-3-like [Rhopalosiphum padi]|uniref:salivary glue protein Sgs-3-like n=1 Tax=Rhopalosiphum padi TaxID=40932 RepID=UPI00298E5B30|nr:salivary glue protein Sgs-3-like [Rhopalosiphum padi]